MWVEHLAGSLGLAVTPSAAGGNNYAWGGAKTGGQPGPLAPFDLSVQIGHFLDAHGGMADPNALYVVRGGGNDALASDVSASASNLGAVITNLANAGATNFLVPNLPERDAFFTEVNNDMLPVLDILESTLSINLTRSDVNVLFTNIVVDALFNGGALFGFTNVSDPCFDGGTVCADPDTYLLWDGVHPTARAHEMIGAAAFVQITTVPLPAGIWLLASALASVAVVRGRRGLNVPVYPMPGACVGVSLQYMESTR